MLDSCSVLRSYAHLTSMLAIHAQRVVGLFPTVYFKICDHLCSVDIDSFSLLVFIYLDLFYLFIYLFIKCNKKNYNMCNML